MAAVSAADLFRAWETGVGRSLPERALVMLELTRPGASDELGSPPIAARDRDLVRLRAQLFGDTLEALVACDGCGAHTSIAVSAADLVTRGSPPPDDDADDGSRSIECDGCVVRIRAPTALELVQAARFAEAAEAAAFILERCVTDAATGDPVQIAALSAGDQASIHEALDRAAGIAGLVLESTCPECGARATTEFDIVAFLWAELSAEIRRLADEVGRLSRAFGWREADILALSAARRRLYLEVAGS